MSKTIKNYENDIISIHNELKDYPNSSTLQKRLSYRLKKWVEMLDISVYVANNEQKPYTSDEVGLPIKSMHTKLVSGFEQVGDYQAFIHNYHKWCGLLVERKGGERGCEDLYGTLMNREQRSRLYREIDRYKADSRFNRFHLIAECSYEDFLNYVPEIFVFTYGSAQETVKKNIIQYLKRFYKIKATQNQIKISSLCIEVNTDQHTIDFMFNPQGAAVLKNGVLVETLVKKISKYGKSQYFVRRGATEVSKIQTINSLECKIQVSFIGSRERAVQKYPGLIRQWCRENYQAILNIQ